MAGHPHSLAATREVNQSPPIDPPPSPAKAVDATRTRTQLSTNLRRTVTSLIAILPCQAFLDCPTSAARPSAFAAQMQWLARNGLAVAA